MPLTKYILVVLHEHTVFAVIAGAIAGILVGAAFPSRWQRGPRSVISTPHSAIAESSVQHLHKVSDKEIRWIAQAVRNYTPQQFHLDHGLWTSSLIAELIHREFGKSLSLTSASRVMKLLGFSTQEPLRQTRQQGAILVTRWEAEMYSQIRATARAVNATVYFARETNIRSGYYAGTKTQPVAKSPVVIGKGRPFSLTMISAVSPCGDFLFMVHDGTVTPPIFIEFLNRLLIGATTPIFVIVDAGQLICKSRLVQDFVDRLNAQLKLFYFPYPASQSNPIQQA